MLRADRVSYAQLRGDRASGIRSSSEPDGTRHRSRTMRVRYPDERPRLSLDPAAIEVEDDVVVFDGVGGQQGCFT